MFRYVFLALIILLTSETNSEADLTQAGFVALSQPPSQADLRCGNYSKTEWSVSVSDGQLQVSEYTNSNSMDKLPFDYDPSPDRLGRRNVMKLPDDGWLVGFDAGEFGGGLWWFSSNGERNLRLKPPNSTPIHPNDIFRAENVQGFAQQGGEILVFMGLDHLGVRSGRIFRIVQQSRQWTLSLLTVLDACPTAWVVNRNSLLVLPETGGSAKSNLLLVNDSPDKCRRQRKPARSIPKR
jgi:hypothetical protein